MSEKSKNETVVFSTKNSEIHLDTPCGHPEQCGAIEFYAERVRYLEKLVKKYKFDTAMTGFMGKQDFNEKLDRVFEEHQFTDSDFTFVIADIDGLHNVNRLDGVDAGDNLINGVANQMKEHFSIDQVYRIGGDEFAIIVRDTVKPFETVVEQMDSIDNITYIAEKSNGYINPRQLLKNADAKLSKLKAQNPCKRM